MELVLSLLLCHWLSPLGAGSVSDVRVGQDAEAKPKTVQIRIAYFLNDREQSASDVCRLWLLAGPDVVSPARQEGSTFSFVPTAGRQTVVLKCETHLVIAELEFDVFDGGTVVLGVMTQRNGLDRQWSPELPLPFGEHYNVIGAYDAGRDALRRSWLKLPAAIREQISSGYVICFWPSAGPRVGMQCFFHEFR
jgi:hypothetical protein